ncbi:MAG TPA: NAD-dependent epimerase/dehydratase family protein [Paludibacter sp.]|nr:NAD-dependent epimerase/dehydratase family protein [Paludibacter sp.]
MILVTGATGLVGGNLLWQLLQEGETVVATRRSTSSTDLLEKIFSFYTPDPGEFMSRIQWRTADILDPGSIRKAMVGISTVYHCAAQVSLGGNDGNLLDTNVSGTRNVVQAALEEKVGKLCFVSSIAACGEGKPGELIDEETPWAENPGRSLYSQSKYLAEQEVWKGIDAGLPAVIVNPGVVLGYSGNGTGSSLLFSRSQRGLPFYVNGGSGYVDVKDVARVMIELVNSPLTGQRFLLVAENCSTLDILNWMADGFGKRRPFIRVGKAVIGMAGMHAELAGKLFRFRPPFNRNTARTLTNRKYYSSRKIEAALGFEFASIETCIHEVCRFMKQKA